MMSADEVLADLRACVDAIVQSNHEPPSCVIFPTQRLRDMFGLRLMPVRKRPKRLEKKIAKRGCWNTTMGTAKARRRSKSLDSYST